MIVVLKSNPEKAQIDNLIKWLETQGVKVHVSEGLEQTVLGLIGDTSGINGDLVKSLNIVEDVLLIREPYKKANRKFHPEDMVIDVGNGTKIGGGNFCVMAGPCSVESAEQIISIARDVKASGATMLRGGAFKPRTSPYSFQGLRGEGIQLLLAAKEETGLPIVTEIMEITQIDCFDEVDMIQVGARNMQNFELLKELGHSTKPVLLKRGLSSTIQELLMSAEYIMAGGNPNVVLCERGIRTFETATRNTLDLAAVPVLKDKTHLPVVVDPSHGTGYSRYVPSMAVAGTAAGADGLMIEVHNDPPHALSDGAQSLTPEAFDRLMHAITRVREIVGELNVL
jgi:3-deoxy-7-phosphoheptulonate synthase